MGHGYKNRCQGGGPLRAHPEEYLDDPAFQEANELEERIAPRRVIDVPSERQIEQRAAAVRRANDAAAREKLGDVREADGEEAFETEE